MEDDRTRTGYDQADEYTKKKATNAIEPPQGYEQASPYESDKNTKQNTTFGVELTPGYEQALPQTDGGYCQLPYVQTPTSEVLNQPHQFEGVVVQKRPLDYTVFSILVCLCCFWPLGVCAMCYATDANTLWKAGDFEGARRKAKISRNLIIASAVIGFIGASCLLAARVIEALQKPSDN